jgi:hypothetical protein
MKISKAIHSALGAYLQSFCTAAGDEFEFDTSKVEDPAALKQAKDRERDEHKTTKTALKDLQAAHEAQKTELETFQQLAKDNVPKTNLEALEKSYKAQIEKTKADAAAEKSKLEKSLHTLLVDNKAIELANELSTAPNLLLPHIKAMLTVETDSEGVAHTRVLEDGKPSAKTLDDLKKDLLANKDYAAILKATKSKGSGASKGDSGSRAPEGQDGDKPFNPNTAKPSELVKYLEAKGAVKSGDGGGE